ncbi:MAG: DUF3365 domain-containing protein [Desulfovibrionaceae bacterium]|nr:DUF3365 domain-containing protein [Desulfovibrionaceae bacterium]MBF0513768.1 DUF3365 domain-containing protein [Desulfovibrionaceae bacterium]
MRNLSIKWKIALLVIIGPVIVGAILAIQQIIQSKQDNLDGVISDSRAIVLMAEAGRTEMAKKLEAGVIRPFEDIPKENILDAIPVITAINMAQENASRLGYQFRVPKISPRNPKNEPTELERSILLEMEAKPELTQKVVVEKDQVRYFRPIRLTKECLYCHGDPAGSKDVTGGVKEGWREGQVHGVFEVIYSLAKFNAETANRILVVIAETLAIIGLIVAAAWFVMKTGILGPLRNIQEFAGKVAGGDLSAKPRGTFTAELAEMKGAIETMVENLTDKMDEANRKTQEAAEENRRAEAAMNEAKAQAEKVKTLLSTMSRVASEAVEIAQQVATASEELSAQVDEVNRGAEVQNERTAQTATAMEEMNATVLEVARNSGSAAESAENARVKALEGENIVEKSVAAIKRVFEQANQLKVEMAELGRQADGISRIMEVISDIADQTNLLALNAAIEAARAGEAGRGFAVVADEVRKLAEKTMNATKEVGLAIDSIQQGARANVQSVEMAAKTIEEATTLVNQSGEALREIVALSNDTSDKVRSIATAAEQQSAASEEINRAIEDISRITSETSEGMSQSAQAVGGLAMQTSQLQGLIEELKA